MIFIMKPANNSSGKDSSVIDCNTQEIRRDGQTQLTG